MSKRRLPRGLSPELAERAYREGWSKKKPKELLHLWVSKEKRRTHKRERREAKKEL